MRLPSFIARGIILLASLVYTCVAATDLLLAITNEAEIVGKVIAEKGGSPLPHVEVFIEELRRGDVSDENGEFRLSQLPPGKYIVSFRLLGYEDYNQPNVVLTSNETIKINVSLTPNVLEMNSLLVTATRTADASYDLPQMVSVVTARKIHERNAQQTPELLREESGLTVQKTNQGGGSPIMRGFKANKLLLLVDGIRMNNATYRGGNTQYLNTIGAASIDRVEIVHGPNSVLYGSDALGGTINVSTRTPRLTASPNFRFGGGLSGNVATAENTKTTHLRLEAANQRVGFLVEGSLQSFGDVERGTNGGGTLMQRLQDDSRTQRILRKKQAPNAYDSYDFTAKSLMQLGNAQRLTAAYQLNRQSEVPRYDVVETLSDSIRLFDPQERDLFYVSFDDHDPTPLYNSLSVTLSFHRQFERRIRQRFGRVQETRDQFRTWTTGLQVQFNKDLGTRHRAVYGTELYYDDVATRSTIRNTQTDDEAATAPVFPNGSSFFMLGVFAQDAFRLSESWEITAGVRFGLTRLRAPFRDDPQSDDVFGNVRQNATSLTGSLGSRLKISDAVSFVTNLSQGFRVPNLDDVSKLGPGGGSSFFDVPNPDTEREKSISLDGGLKLRSHQINASIIGFYNYVTDLLVRRRATFGGSPFVVDGSDTLSVFRKENAGEAFTAGFTSAAEILLQDRLSVFGNFSYTYGENLSDDEPVSGIPPFTGLVGVRWRDSKFWTEVNSRFATEQSRLSLSDLEDLRIPEGGTPGWWTLNVRGGLEVSRHLALNLSIANIFDQNYREHLSGLNAPGRNFILAARFDY